MQKETVHLLSAKRAVEGKAVVRSKRPFSIFDKHIISNAVIYGLSAVFVMDQVYFTCFVAFGGIDICYDAPGSHLDAPDFAVRRFARFTRLSPLIISAYRSVIFAPRSARTVIFSRPEIFLPVSARYLPPPMPRT